MAKDELHKGPRDHRIEDRAAKWQASSDLQEEAPSNIAGSNQSVCCTRSLGVEEGEGLKKIQQVGRKSLYLFCTKSTKRQRVNASLKVIYPLLLVAGTGLEPATFGL